MHKHSAILLLGPTGSGKTPLGEYLQARGLWGRRCVHFDFGENLRRLVRDAGRQDVLTSEELAVVEESLRTGALLENEHFIIAGKILLAVIQGRQVHQNDLVVLNGLPRHVGQAKDVDELMKVEAIIELSCSPQVVSRRIQTDPGGDRADRTDDDIEAVRRKLDIFRARTAPLVEHYRRAGARVETVDVQEATLAADVWKTLNG